MWNYARRLLVVAAIFIFSIGLGVLVTQEGGRLPLQPDQMAAASGVYDFTWSPDGKSIAYVTSSTGGSDLWIVASTGGAPRRVTSSLFVKKKPRWSRDGNWIAYVGFQPGKAGDIHLVTPDGGSMIALTESPADETDPTWSPDSQQIAFTETSNTDGRIVVANIQTGTMKELTEISAADLQWAPDGRSIAFVSNPLQPRDDRRENQDIFVVAVDGGLPRLLTPGTPRFRDASPSWSPDSRYIAYASEETGYSNIYTLDTQTGARRTVTSGDTDRLAPKWSPAGNTIAYLHNEHSVFDLFVTSAEGGATIVSERGGVNGGFENEEATPHGAVRWAPDGRRIAFTHSDPGRVSDIWIASLDGSRPVQLTNTMPPELRRGSRFVSPETITYRSFDGQEISGLVYKPRGIKPRSGYPALLVFRDTIDGQHAAGWDPFIQFFVSDDYLVFAPNIRGSSGYGRDYRQFVFGNGGDHDIRDAFFGLDRLSSEGLVDTERVGVFGSGTGGFLATAALVKDEARFKAAVSLNGIVDAVTASSYPAFASWSRYVMGSTAMENPQAYYVRSLVNFVDKLRTPIIFLSATRDTPASIQQLQQFAVQAEVKGKWYDYRLFNDESGGWQSWRPGNRRLAMEAMDALFEKHLLGRDREIRLTRNR